MASNIKTVGVIGVGVIGASWTALFLAKGLRVIACSTSAGAEQKLAAFLEKAWPTLEAIGLSPGASLSNYQFVGETLEGYYDQVDFVQENAPERPDLKRRIFAEVDAATRPEVIIASSSSGLPSSVFITDCKNKPGRILIGHPFNPPHLLPLVEVVPHPGVDKEVSEVACEFYRSLGKNPILVKKETPGFIANRLQAVVASEAFSLVQRGVVTAEELDTCVTAALGPRWALTGPFMSYVLGGGGGKEGFSRLMNHLAVGAQVWLDDIHANSIPLNQENIKILDNSVQQMLEKSDPSLVEKERDAVTLQLLKMKADSKHLQ